MLYDQKNVTIAWDSSGSVFDAQSPKMAPVRRRPKRVQNKIDMRRGMLHYGDKHTLCSGIAYMAQTVNAVLPKLERAAKKSGEAFSRLSTKLRSKWVTPDVDKCYNHTEIS